MFVKQGEEHLPGLSIFPAGVKKKQNFSSAFLPQPVD
jgi:hypothetical protein